MVGWHLSWIGRVKEGLAQLEAAHQAAVDLNQPIIAWLSGWAISTLAGSLLDPVLQESAQRRELDSARLDGAPELRRLSHSTLGSALLGEGRLSEARSLFEITPPTGGVRIRQLLVDGRWAEAASLTGDLVAHEQSAGDLWQAGWNLSTLARLAATAVPGR